MYQCKYCNRYLKDNYINCPGCGSNSFQKITNPGIIKITEVPKGGYKVNTNNMKEFNFLGSALIFVGVFFSVGVIPEIIFFYSFSMIMKEETGDIFGIMPVIIGFIFATIGFFLIYFGVKSNKKNKDKIKRVRKLAESGVLFKNLNYNLVPSGSYVNGNVIYCVEVIYENSRGIKIPLVSEPKYDGRLSRADGTVDLLIDENDTSNYFIDFEIY